MPSSDCPMCDQMGSPANLCPPPPPVPGVWGDQGGGRGKAVFVMPPHCPAHGAGQPLSHWSVVQAWWWSVCVCEGGGGRAQRSFMLGLPLSSEPPCYNLIRTLFHVDQTYSCVCMWVCVCARGCARAMYQTGLA